NSNRSDKNPDRAHIACMLCSYTRYFHTENTDHEWKPRCIPDYLKESEFNKDTKHDVDQGTSSDSWMNNSHVTDQPDVQYNNTIIQNRESAFERPQKLIKL